VFELGLGQNAVFVAAPVVAVVVGVVVVVVIVVGQPLSLIRPRVINYFIAPFS
jgi:hypothetical protein